MKRIAILLILVTRVFAGVNEEYAAEFKRFASLVADCDKLTVSSQPFAPDNERRGITIEGTAAVKKVIGGIQVSPKLLVHDTIIQGGKEMVLRLPCDCYGEGDLLLFKSGQLVVKARIFHWKTLDVETALGDRFVLDLVGRSKEVEELWKLFFEQPNGKTG